MGQHTVCMCVELLLVFSPPEIYWQNGTFLASAVFSALLPNTCSRNSNWGVTHVLKHGSPDRRVIPMITYRTAKWKMEFSPPRNAELCGWKPNTFNFSFIFMAQGSSIKPRNSEKKMWTAMRKTRKFKHKTRSSRTDMIPDKLVSSFSSLTAKRWKLGENSQWSGWRVGNTCSRAPVERGDTSTCDSSWCSYEPSEQQRAAVNSMLHNLCC